MIITVGVGSATNPGLLKQISSAGSSLALEADLDSTQRLSSPVACTDGPRGSMRKPGVHNLRSCRLAPLTVLCCEGADYVEVARGYSALSGYAGTFAQRLCVAKPPPLKVSVSKASVRPLPLLGIRRS